MSHYPSNHPEVLIIRDHYFMSFYTFYFRIRSDHPFVCVLYMYWGLFFFCLFFLSTLLFMVSHQCSVFFVFFFTFYTFKVHYIYICEWVCNLKFGNDKFVIHISDIHLQCTAERNSTHTTVINIVSIKRGSDIRCCMKIMQSILYLVPLFVAR